MTLDEFNKRWPERFRREAENDGWYLGCLPDGRVGPWTVVPQISGSHLMPYIERRAADGNAAAQRALELIAITALLR